MKGQTSNISGGTETVTVRVAMTFRKRGGRRFIVVSADPTELTTPAPTAYNVAVRALVRAFYWRGLFESGQFGSIAEFAAARKVDKSYLSKMIRLTLLAPAVVEGILDETEAHHIPLERLLAPFPVDWERQPHWFSH